jgi:hypothetical protein
LSILAALAVAQTYPIFPCNPANKRPLTEHGFKDASRDEGKILQWWASHPDALIGVPTGAASGLVVVDDDTVKKPSAISSDWVAANRDVLGSTLKQKTVSGGTHYIFAGSGVATRGGIEVEGVKLPSIDTRGEGGYIIYWAAHGLPSEGNLRPLPPSLLAQLTQAQAAVSLPQVAPPDSWLWQVYKQELPGALKFLDSSDRDTWYQAGMSIHYEGCGSEEAFDIWHDWSATAPRGYIDRDDCVRTWLSFGKSKNKKPRTIKSLFKDAREAGYVPPPQTARPALPPVLVVGRQSLTASLPPGTGPIIPTIPPPPESLMIAPPATGRGAVVPIGGQTELWEEFAYVEDIHRIVDANGLLLDSSRFDVRYGGREFIVDYKGGATCKSAWDAFTKSEIVEFPQVRGTLFDPLSEPGLIVTRDGMKYINVYSPIEIRAEAGDPSRFINHLKILFPHDWLILLSYLKFMVQHKGRKSTWWPFLQGVPGNGKSFISDTMEYCIGQKYTQRPTPKNIDSQFNASLYACLFIALEDVKVKEDHGALWETLKPMVTQTRIEIQPKGVDKVTREVCFNGILNSNHKDGIRKEPDDRRIAPFFAAQQRKADLTRDGLTPAYFTELWDWAHADGWAHVAHYLATDPIEEQWNPATRCKVAPITSSTEEAIGLGLGPAEQEVIESVRIGKPGFKGGWVSMYQFELLLKQIGRAKYFTPYKRRECLELLGYVTHPGLVEGFLPMQLTDGSMTTIYVKSGHSSSQVTDANLIKALYEAAQRA